MTLALVVNDLGVFFVGVPVVGTRTVLQLGNRIRRPHVFLTTAAPGIFTTCVKPVGQHRVCAVGGLVHANGLFGYLKYPNALDAAGCAGEVLLYRVTGQANRFKQLGAAVTHVGTDTHLGHDLGQALANGFNVVVDGFVSIQITGQILAYAGQCFHGQIRVNRLSAVTCQHRKVMHFARGTGLNHQARRSSQTFTHQVLVYR